MSRCLKPNPSRRTAEESTQPMQPISITQNGLKTSMKTNICNVLHDNSIRSCAFTKQTIQSQKSFFAF